MTTLEEFENGIRLASAGVLEFLRSDPDVHALTPGGSWTVRDTAVHIIIGARLYTRLMNGQPPPIDWLPAEANAWNAGAFTALDEDDPAILADLLEQATGTLIAASREHGPDDSCPYYAAFGGQLTVGALSAIQINEYLLHWADMAAAVGREWPCPESAAEIPFAIQVPIVVPFFFDSSAAGALDASFALDTPKMRLGYRVRSGNIEALAEETDYDCSIAGPASRWLLWISGRAEWQDWAPIVSDPSRPCTPLRWLLPCARWVSVQLALNAGRTASACAFLKAFRQEPLKAVTCPNRPGGPATHSVRIRLDRITSAYPVGH